MKQLLMVSIIALFLLLVAGWGQQATAGGPTVDHYKCYKVKGKAFKPKLSVNVVDEFETDTDTVVKPFMVCNPANKNNEGVAHSNVHQVCYKIKGEKKLESGLTLDVDNQFAQNQIVKTAKKEKLLCVPSFKDCIDKHGNTIACPNEP
jgi:hypothetical protein